LVSPSAIGCHLRFSAGLLFNITLTMIYLLTSLLFTGSMNRVVSAQTIQLKTR